MRKPPESDRPRPTAVVFDLGGVLIDWDPRYLYRSLLPDDDAIEEFLQEVSFREWNEALDRGRDWDEATAWLAARHPSRASLIEAYRDRWEESLGAPDAPVVAILDELHAAGVPLHALSNWSDRTFQVARHRFPFLERFEGIVISGQVGLAKPDAAIFEHLLDRFELEPTRTVFIDDQPANVEAAAALGITAIRFTDADALRAALVTLGLLGAENARDASVDGAAQPR
jgi:2-haloacid dehalogenase